MYYTPPKSSIWGHSLREMKPALVRERFKLFLELAVDEYSWSSHTLSVDPTSWPDTGGRAAPLRRHFETLLGVAAPRSGYLWYITEDQCESCIDELIREPALYTDKDAHVSVVGTAAISAWRVDGQPISTKSELSIAYGSAPRISGMYLKFDTLETYESVKQAFETAKLCRLNDKHLKGRS